MEQLRTLDVGRLGPLVGHLGLADQESVDRALGLVLTLDRRGAV
ncbi:hypothetical protein [Ornithinimicrobium sp. W1665]